MSNDGMNYAPKGKSEPVVEAGEFVFAATALEHGHVYGQCNGLREAGATLKWVYDKDPAKVEKFKQAYPEVQVARDLDEILQDNEVKLVAAADIPADRCSLGLKVMDHGKDYFTDKTPMTSVAQVDEARKKVAETGQKYAVYYSERLHVESAVHAGNLIADGAIGRVVNVIGMGPHRLGGLDGRPDWFYEKARYGGILSDIGSHQIEQFLFYTGAKDAKIASARVGNFRFKEKPELEDFGDASLIGDNGANSYFRVDWLNPDGLDTWGDGRTFILGTHGYIELRKYTNVAMKNGQDHLFLVNDEGMFHQQLWGKVGFPYFGQLILDCLNRTENAMTQEHTFKAAELCNKCQEAAVWTETAEGGTQFDQIEDMWKPQG